MASEAVIESAPVTRFPGVKNRSPRRPHAGALLPMLLSVLAAASCSVNALDVHRAPLLTTFDQGGATAFSKKLLRHKAISIAEGAGVDGSTGIRVVYQGSPLGSERVIVGHMLPAGLLEATLMYDVKFCDAFQFVKSGKLHGLAPEDIAAGGLPFDAEQWSARVAFLANGRIATYLYHQDLRGRYGEVTPAADFRFEPGRYYRVALYVRLNDPPEAHNGRAELFVDGVSLVSQDGLRFRAVPGSDSLIRQLLFNTFHGGNTPDYAPRNPDGSYGRVCAYFDNIAVFPGLAVQPVPY